MGGDVGEDTEGKGEEEGEEEEDGDESSTDVEGRNRRCTQGEEGGVNLDAFAGFGGRRWLKALPALCRRARKLTGAVGAVAARTRLTCLDRICLEGSIRAMSELGRSS